MSAHLSEELLERLQRHELPPEKLLPALRHLGDCAECTALATHSIAVSSDDLRRIIDAPVDISHLDPDTQMIPYVDGILIAADREIVESHLNFCEVCTREVEDLQALQTTRRGRRGRPALWLAVAAAATGVAVLLGVLSRQDDQRVAPTVLLPPAPVIRHTAAPTTTLSSGSLTRYGNPEWNTLVSEASKTGRLPFPADLHLLNPPAGVLRGTSVPASSSVSPSGIVIDDARPEFQWSAPSGATFVVSIFEGNDEVSTSPKLTSPRWTPDRPLRRGRTYTWQVEATQGETTLIIPAAPAPPAIFRIVSESDHSAIREALAQYPDDHFLHAVLYAKSGLRTQAEASLARSASRN